MEANDKCFKKFISQQTTFLLLFFSILILTGCNHRHVVSMTFEDVFIKNDLNNGENENALFYIKVNNLSPKNITVNQEDFQNRSLNSGFYLISSELYSGAIKLSPSAGSFERKIECGKTAKLALLLPINELQFLLFKINKVSSTYEDLKTFLKQGNYYVVYMSFKEPQTMNVPKSNSFKVLESESPDTLNKILGP